MWKLSDIIPNPISKLLRRAFRTRWKRRLRLIRKEGTEVVEASVGKFMVCDIYTDDKSLTLSYIEEARELGDDTIEHNFTYYYADPNSFDIDKIVDKIYSLYKREIDVQRYSMPELEKERSRNPRVTIDDLKDKLAEEVDEPDF